MKIANYKKTNGKLLGWYDSEIHETIPTPNIEVSEADWQTALDNGYNFVNAKTKKLSLKDFRTFAELRVVKKQEIKTSYNSANEVDIAYMSTTFQADKDSQDLIARNLSIGSVPNGFYWKDKNNNKVAMTYVELQGLGSVIQTRSMGNYGKLSTLKAQTKVAKKQADLDVIVW